MRKNCGVAREVFDGKELQVFLEDVPWGKIARDGTEFCSPFGIGLGKTLSFNKRNNSLNGFSNRAGADSQLVCGQRKVG